MKFIGKIIVFVFLFCGNVKGQKFEWVKTFGANSQDISQSISTDAAGNFYIIGYFQETVDFDPGTGTFNITAPGVSADTYILKLDPLGNFVWAKSLYGTGFSQPSSFLIDPSGSLYLSGYFTGVLDFDPGLATLNLTSDSGSNDGYILKLDSDGNLVWVKQIDGSSHTYIYSASLDLSGNIVLFGKFKTTVDFDPGPGTYNLTSSSATNDDLFILKLNSLGNFVSAKKIGGTLSENAFKIVTDPFGNFYLTGDFSGTVDFNSGTGVFYMTALGSSDLFIEKLDPVGNFIWAKQITTTGLSAVSGSKLISNNANEIIISGGFTGTCDFDPGLGVFNIAASSSDIFVEKLDTSGNFIWAKAMSGPNFDYCLDIKETPSGEIFLTGYFGDSVDFDPGPTILNRYSNGQEDMFVQKLNAAGDNLWVMSMGGHGSDEGQSIYIDDLENIYTCGTFTDTTDFDPSSDTLNYLSTGTTWYMRDAFFLKWSKDSCANLALFVDSVSVISCSAIGYASSHAFNGLAPYNYSWSTTPIINDSISVFTTDGIFSITVTDANSCIRTVSVLMNGPGTLSAFELDANLLATGFQPTLNSTLWLNGFNDGCDTVSGNLRIILDPLVSFSSSIPSPDFISGDTLNWNFSSLTYDSSHFTPQINVVTSAAAMIGDTICFNVLINPIIGDADSSNNIKTYCFPVVSSYDPNIKSVYPQGDCVPKFVLKNEKLTYTIQFQNTGTADAINIYLLDTLDANLDLNSVRVIGHSDYVITEVLPGNVLKFRFDNIYLPDSTTDEPNSHGYVIYEIDPLSAVPNNTIINNTAHIFFDFNPAVVTNTVSNTIIDTLPNYSSTQNVNLLCGSNYIFPDGTIQNDITANISHISNLASVLSCDSIITTNITIIPIDVTLTVGGFSMFTANASGLNYQWVLDCGFNWTPILGDTNQTFNTGMEGSFGVIITNGTCSDTSICYTIGAVNDFNKANSLSVYPNPTNATITISTANIVANKIELKDVYGRTIKVVQPNSSQTIMDLQSIESGIYFVTVMKNNIGQTVKIVKQ